MHKSPTTTVNVRLDKTAAKALSVLRRMSDPIPSASEVMRRALIEKYERDVKKSANGHERLGKRERAATEG